MELCSSRYKFEDFEAYLSKTESALQSPENREQADYIKEMLGLPSISDFSNRLRLTRASSSGIEELSVFAICECFEDSRKVKTIREIYEEWKTLNSEKRSSVEYVSAFIFNIRRVIR